MTLQGTSGLRGPHSNVYREGTTAALGEKKQSSLDTWRRPVTGPRTAHAHNLRLHIPHNLYKNSVIQMLHQAMTRTGNVTGLAALNGPLAQAVRSESAITLTRGPEWEFLWQGW